MSYTASLEPAQVAIRDRRSAQTGLRMAISGGGTGGHIVPGLHLLDHLRSGSDPLGNLLWFGSGRGVEQRVLSRLSERTGDIPVDVVKLTLEPRGGGAPSWVGLGLRLAPSVQKARRELLSHGSQVVLGLGGFVTLPVVMAARSLGIPVALLEINAVSGKANRLLAPMCQRVYHAWRGSMPTQRGERHVHVGAPVSPQLMPATSQRIREVNRERLGMDPTRPLLVVMGGSQGAGALNDFIASARADLVGAGHSIIHQVGPGKLDSKLHAGDDHYRACEYLDDVPCALRAADLVLCRGGASTLAEIAAVQVPAWVVPFPYHRDRHQEHNAAELGEGVRVVPEHRLVNLTSTLVGLLGANGEADRMRMARALVGCARPNAARTILTDLDHLAHSR